MKKNWYLLAFFVLSIPALWSLFKPGYISMHDDLQVMRLYEMEKCFKDGQIPCRWVPDMGAGYGFPLFNYYAPLPYYFGMIFRQFGFSYIWSIKMLFAISLIVSGYFMYLLVKEFGGKFGGLVASVLYVYVPYHAVQIYVRGALGESWGMLFAPLLLWGIYKFIKENKIVYFSLSIISLSFILTSHNIISLVFVPVSFLWTALWIFISRDMKKFIKAFLIYVWGGAISAFFTIPALFEKSLVSINSLTTGYNNYELHFVSIKQLFFDRFWGYGPSVYGQDDKLSFQLGVPYWLLAALAGMLFIYFLLRKKKKLLPPVFFGLVVFCVSVFMTHSKSIWIWKAMPLLAFMQFPWRFLAVAMLSTSFLAGVLAGFGRFGKFVGVLSIVMAITLNFVYFKPERFYPTMTDAEKLSGKQWEDQSKAAILDYLPVGAEQAPNSLASNRPKIVDGEADVTTMDKRSDLWHFDASVYTDSDAVIEIPVFDFPYWNIIVDGKPIEYGISKPYGLMEIKLGKGKHIVVGWFENTSLRLVANALSLFSVVALFFYVELASNYEKKLK